jgi:hypothetical protein
MSNTLDKQAAVDRHLADLRREQAQQREGEEFAQAFSRFVNDSRRKPKAAAIDKMLREHRTLQQGMMRFVMDYIEAMSEQQTDLRNEASVKLAKAIMELPSNVRALPYI